MDGAERIAAERARQMSLEGWTPEHDDEHDKGDLRWAACCYIKNGGFVATPRPNGGNVPREWPWDASWWKPSNDPIRNLEKAGALIAAEIDRLLRKRSADLDKRLDDLGVQ